MTTTPFLFFSGGVPLAGRMHRDPAAGVERQPAVLVTGSWLTVKEQMPDRYAAALAGRGYTALTFDFAGFGTSGGEPRQLESPTRKMADLAAAAAYARSLSLVTAGPPALLAVCASAQYGLAAAARGLELAAFCGVAGWFHDLPSVAPLYGGADGVAERLARADEALERYLRDGEVVTVPAYDPEDERAGMPMPLPYYAETDRGRVPAWRNEMAEMSWRPWLTFDGLAAADTVSVPAHFVHGDGAVLPDNVRRIAGRMGAGTTWLDGDQVDFYDRPAQVDAAVAAADELFRKSAG
jgi:fermentation-respiration switch protein FrsA (DUF1100 family)